MRIMQEWGLSEELKIQTKQMIEIAEKRIINYEASN